MDYSTLPLRYGWVILEGSIYILVISYQTFPEIGKHMTGTKSIILYLLKKQSCKLKFHVFHRNRQECFNIFQHVLIVLTLGSAVQIQGIFYTPPVPPGGTGGEPGPVPGWEPWPTNSDRLAKDSDGLHTCDILSLL